MHVTFKRGHRPRRSLQSGQALIEFMLTSVFLVLLVASILEVADFIYTYSVMADAAKEGVRYAIVHGANSTTPSTPGSGASASSPPCNATNATTDDKKTGATVGGITNAVKSFAAFSLHSTNSVNVFVCYLDGTNSLTSRVEVAVSYQYQPFFFKWPSVTVFANSAGRIVF